MAAAKGANAAAGAATVASGAASASGAGSSASTAFLPSAAASAAAAAAARSAVAMPPVQLFVIPNGDRVGVLVVGPAAALLWPPHDSFLATERMAMHTMVELHDATASHVRLYGAIPRQDAVGAVYIYIAGTAPNGQQVVLRRNYVGMLPPGLSGAPPMPGSGPYGMLDAAAPQFSQQQYASAPQHQHPQQHPHAPASRSLPGSNGSQESLDGMGSSVLRRPTLPDLSHFGASSGAGSAESLGPPSSRKGTGGRRVSVSYVGRAPRGSAEPRAAGRRRELNVSAAAAAAAAAVADGTVQNGIFREPCLTWCQDWTNDEHASGRRLIRFWTHPVTTEVCACPASIVPQADTPMASTTVISCIYWDRLDDYFITGCDFFRLMEGLAAEPFDKERRSRIRRLLEPFTGRTVHQSDGNVQDFFSQVMAYGPPKPRTAVKDFKVYPWRQLELAVIKVMNWDHNPKRRYGNPLPAGSSNGGGVAGHGQSQFGQPSRSSTLDGDDAHDQDPSSSELVIDSGTQ